MTTSVVVADRIAKQAEDSTAGDLQGEIPDRGMPGVPLGDMIRNNDGCSHEDPGRSEK